MVAPSEPSRRGALADRVAGLVADHQGAVAVERAIAHRAGGIEEDMLAAPVGIAGEHVPEFMGEAVRGKVSLTSPL